MENGLIVLAIGMVVGIVLFVTWMVMRVKEAKDLEQQNSMRDERDARMIQKWAAREARRAR